MIPYVVLGAALLAGVFIGLVGAVVSLAIPRSRG